MKMRLWTRDFSLLTAATVLGAAGGIAGSAALSFLVYDETGSTLAAALLIAIRLIPSFLLPVVVAPLLDRYPRKPFLVGGDLLNGIMYAMTGWYLLNSEFSYAMYLWFSLLLSTLNVFDDMAYNSLYPNLIPEGCEQQGYAVSGALYSLLAVIVTPLAALLYETIGIGRILLAQGVLSMLAAGVENLIRMKEPNRTEGKRFDFAMWKGDMRDALSYLRRNRGLQAIYTYTAVSNGMASGYAPLMVAFFRSTPGLNLMMYSSFTAAECLGRVFGGLFHARVPIPRRQRYRFALSVYVFYESMDMLLLWLGYPLMMANRAMCGFLGINSASLREAAVQRFLPDELRAKLNAFSEMLISLSCAVLSLAVGALGELLDYRVCVSMCGAACLVCCLLTIVRQRAGVKRIYEGEAASHEAEGPIHPEGLCERE